MLGKNKWVDLRNILRSQIAIKRHFTKSNAFRKAMMLRNIRIRNRRAQKAHSVSQSNNKWIVLLTTCIKTTPLNSISNQEYRTELYKEQIQKWLNNTNYEIVVVESSGSDSFSDLECNNRLHVYKTIVTDCGSSSQSEANSIMYVLGQIQNEDFYLNCTHILKVTGRYYLQNIQHILQNYPKQDMNMYVQQHKNSNIRWQHTEYYGIKKELFKDMLEPVVIAGLMEHRFYDFIDMNRNVCVLPSFPNKIPTGGTDRIIDPL
jgi:hypothetical protein